MSRKPYISYDPEESLPSPSDQSSILGQIPIKYDEYKVRNHNRHYEKENLRPSHSHKNELKIRVEPNVQESVDLAQRQYLDTDTPIFSNNRTIESSDINLTNKVGSQENEQDGQFKEMVETAFG